MSGSGHKMKPYNYWSRRNQSSSIALSTDTKKYINSNLVPLTNEETMVENMKATTAENPPIQSIKLVKQQEITMLSFVLIKTYKHSVLSDVQQNRSVPGRTKDSTLWPTWFLRKLIIALKGQMLKPTASPWISHKRARTL